MKVCGVNSSLGLVNFNGQNEQVQSEPSVNKFAQIDKKKLLYATLGALALAGTVAVIVKNAKKGKVEIPTGTKGISSPAQAPKPEQLKPVDIKVINEKPEFSPEALDRRAVNGAVKEDVWSFDDMKEYYQDLDNKGKKQVEQIIDSTRKQLSGKPEFSPEALEKRAINGEVKSNAWSKEDMAKYYENDCAQVYECDKFKSLTYPVDKDGNQVDKCIYKANSNMPEGTVRIRTTKYAEKDKYGYWKNSSYSYSREEIFSPDGKLIQSSISSPHAQYFNKGAYFSIVKSFDENGKIAKIVSDDKTGHTETVFYEGVKTSTHTNKDGSKIFKIYEQDANGKYHCIKRESYDEKFLENVWGHIGKEYNTKTVEYINNGKYSKTTTENLKHCYVMDDENTVKTVIRDRKGNIIDASKIKTSKPKPSKGGDGPDSADMGKLLAPWYKDYLKLCQKYGVSPRPCGVKGGAGDHYFELCLRRSDPEAYKRYLRLQEYRARYDEKAMTMEILRNGDEKGLALSPELLNKLSPEDIKTLISYVNKGYINVQELQNISPANIKKLFARAQKQEEMVKAAREAERRLEEQQEAERMRHQSNTEREREIIVYA